MTARLESGQTIAILGQYDLVVTKGVVMLYGAILRAGPQTRRILAPASHALPVIRCLSPDGSEVQLKSVRLELGSLENLSPLYGRLWKANTTAALPASKSSLQHDKLHWSFDNIHKLSDDPLGRPLYHLETPSEWQKPLDKICSSPPGQRLVSRVLVCGPKSSGKSTFSRMLLNRMFTVDRDVLKADDHSVFLLDIDPGQPEYAPPGQVSLIELQQPVLGPPLVHPSANTGLHQRTIRSHFIGANSPKDNPEHYVDCVLDLMKTYQKHIDADATYGPLVINSAGWTVGTGLTILLQLLEQLDITDVVYTTEEAGRTLDALSKASTTKKARMHILTAQPSGPNAAGRTAAEFRDMQMMSYFHLGAPKQRDPFQTWDATPLSGRRPYVLQYGENGCDFLGIMALGEAVTPCTLSNILNGAIIGIAVLDAESETVLAASGLDIARTPDENLPYLVSRDGKGQMEPLDPRTCRLIGLALVRSIDVKTQTLHIISPNANDHLIEELRPERTVLMLGNLDTPGWAYLEDLHLAAQKKAAKQKKEQAGSGAAVEDAEGEVVGAELDDDDAEIGEGNLPWLQKETGEGVGIVGAKRRLRRFVN
ncbi:uncharacterized protein K452DRAFT_306341 [Aplosporella prunicola CBS 121167]|uniref:Polynucleotide 5'-hydroxyl-kinase GRC3 n=1 Tax=Aplosporella prunicola CBS 121167 TaxID=1176127 RepID=A0A6A6BK76_9PEZI|nr:uncharacterized protein K452DRAFT_306341 [Aplosporella prunicola CBS 121167]KAF2144519.1 hypothetical protein K452DRAFT_306341 [Aplosporella prunicola CBS 121167]